MSAFAAALGALFADPNIGRNAVYVAEGGAPVPVRVVVRRADAVTDFGDARLWSETTRIDVRVAEVPAPRPGDRIEIDGDAFLVHGEPLRDRERLIWTLALQPLPGATAPAAFGPGDWSLINAPSAGGDRLALEIVALPDDGDSAIIMLEWRISGGAAHALANAGLGLREITVLAGAEAVVSIRAANAVGPGPWCAAKTAAPTALSPAPPDWPEGAIAVWLIVGKSNADGYGPYAQDPARLSTHGKGRPTRELVEAIPGWFEEGLDSALGVGRARSDRHSADRRRSAADRSPLRGASRWSPVTAWSVKRRWTPANTRLFIDEACR